MLVPAAPTADALATMPRGRRGLWGTLLAVLLLFAMPVHCQCGHMTGTSRTWATAMDDGMPGMSTVPHVAGGQSAPVAGAAGVVKCLPTVMTAPDDAMAVGIVAVPAMLADLWVLPASVARRPVPRPEVPVRRRSPAPPTPPPRFAV